MVSRRTGAIAGLLAAAVVTILVVGVGVARAAGGMFRLTLQASATRVPEGTTITFTGRFTIDGGAVDGITVDIISDTGIIASPITDQFGNYQADVLFPLAGTFIVKARAPLPAE